MASSSQKARIAQRVSHFPGSSCFCSGGAVYSDSPVSLSSSSFTRNTAVQVGSTGSWPTEAGGGALRVSNGNLLLNGIKFIGEQRVTKRELHE